LHGGAARVESVLDEGSQFTVTVPLGRAHLDPQHVKRSADLAPARTGAQSYVEEALRWLPELEQETEQPWLVSSRSSKLEVDQKSDVPNSVRPRIIWADDNADMRGYVARLLGKRF